MPWKVNDVDKFKRGLSDEAKKRWVAIANGTLAECMKEEGADELECEVKAIRVANATADGKSKAAALSLAETPNPLHISDHKDTLHLALAETPSGEDGEYQLAFPIGLFRTSKYGELIVTETYAQRMVENWKLGVLGKRNVFMDTEHDFGEANAWARDLRVTEQGLEIAWDFTSKGRDLISDRRYRYYSAAIGWATDLETGDEHYPVLQAVSLTNMPVMNTMPEAHLSEGNSLTHRDEETITEEESMETLKDVMDAFLNLSTEERGKASDEDRARLATALELTLADPKVITELSVLREERADLFSQVRNLSAEIETLRAEALVKRRDELIGAALADGRILEKDKEIWIAKFNKNPEFTAEVLADLPKAIDYNRYGTTRGKNIVQVSDAVVTVAQHYGMDPIEAQALIDSVSGPKDEDEEE